MIVAFDPGVNTGWAVFDDPISNSTKLFLAACGLIQWSEFAVSHSPLWTLITGHNGTVVIEMPQVYRAARSKGDPNDLIETAFRAGLLVAWSQMRLGRLSWRLKTPRPREWKGQLTKDVHHRRIERALSPDERQRMLFCGVAKSLLHNVIDAVGLGLWEQGRL